MVLPRQVISSSVGEIIPYLPITVLSHAFCVDERVAASTLIAASAHTLTTVFWLRRGTMVAAIAVFCGEVMAEKNQVDWFVFIPNLGAQADFLAWWLQLGNYAFTRLHKPKPDNLIPR